MNRYILTITCILSSIIFMTIKADACVNEAPEPGIFNSSPIYTVVGQTVYFDGYTYSYDPDEGDPYGEGNGITEWYWEIWDEWGYIDDMLDSNPSYSFDTAGYYTVFLYVKDNDNTWSTAGVYGWDTVYVYVSEVAKIVEWYGYTDEGPLYVPVNAEQKLFAFSNPYYPPYYVIFPPGYPVWSVIDQPSGSSPSLTTFDSLCCEGGSTQDSATISNLSVPGKYTVRATAGTSSDDIDIIAVKVDKIQYKIGTDAYQDCPNPLVVAKGADVTFKAVINPTGASWPSEKPTWVVNSIPSGTSETKTVSFNTASNNPNDNKIITVSCGNMKIANVIVVDLSTLKIDSHRTSNPVETSYEVTYNDHFELGGTFQFDLKLGSWPTPVKMGSEIWDLDWSNQVLVSGTGTSISHIFGTGPNGSYDDGTCDVCFYFDNDTSGNSTSGDPQIDSYDFEVKTLVIQALAFIKCSETSGTPDLDLICNNATERICMKNTQDDYRSAAKVEKLISLTVHDSDDHAIIEVYETSPFDKRGDLAYFESTEPFNGYDVIIVSGILKYDHDDHFTGWPHGIWVSPKIYVDIEYFNGRLLAHEIGHVKGLNELYEAHLDYIMCTYQDEGYGYKLHLNEIDNYELIPWPWEY